LRYEGKIYRPPSEANSYILQATIGCSWNKCVYCDMYRDKQYRERDLTEVLTDVETAASVIGPDLGKVFVADGDALGMSMAHWQPILGALEQQFPRLKRVSCYATAQNLLQMSMTDLRTLRTAGLQRLYIGPESGDDVTLKRIAKGATFADHVEAAQKAHEAGFELSVIALLGVGGRDRSEVHARETGRLVTEMDPAFFAALTTTIIPGTPLARMASREKFVLPSVHEMLGELKEMLREAQPTSALFRTNHASNYLPLAGRIPQDSEALMGKIEAALEGRMGLRPEWLRNL